MDHEHKVNDLDRLIRTNMNVEETFHTAAKDIKNTELESQFMGYAKQHAKFAAELEDHLKHLGSDAPKAGTSDSALHRGWTDLKAAFSGHSTEAILKSCEDSEESAEIAYADVADGYSSGQIHTLIAKHRQQIKEIHTRLARLVGETKDGLDFQKNE